VAVAFAFPQILKQFDGYTGGSQGLLVPAASKIHVPAWTGLTDVQFSYLLILLDGAVAFALVRNVVQGRWGLALIALRDNAISAASMGVDPASTKVVSFALSAALAGLGGALQAVLLGYVSPDSVNFQVSVLLLTGVIVGGLGTIYGPLIGGLVVVVLPNLAATLSQDAPGVVYGIVIVLAMVLAPAGIAGLCRRTWKGFRGWLARGRSPRWPAARNASTAPPVLRRIEPKTEGD
jgi:branched-chain amino acid transport system permease protein